MTDNEIIKAWECCKNWESTKDCDDCPVNVGCSQKLAKYSLDLIKRKDAEIERLNDYNLNLITANTALSNEILEIKSEAMKEFAEELEYFVLNEDIEVVEPKCKDYESYINGANQFRHQIKNGINNHVKEMTE